MDDVDRYVKILSDRFPDQLVLYLDDIAKVLGTSKRAVEGLLQRKSFPFQTRKVGGKVAVDLFQLARYLAGSEQAEEASSPAKSVKRAKTVKAAAPVRASKPAEDDKYSMRKALADWRRERAYNCYSLLKEPEQVEPQEGLLELFQLLLLQLLPVDEPAAGASHIALWVFEARRETMESTLVTFDTQGVFSHAGTLIYRLRERLGHHRLALVRAIRNGQCIAESFYMQGEMVCGLDPKELVTAWQESAPA